MIHPGLKHCDGSREKMGRMEDKLKIRSVQYYLFKDEGSASLDEDKTSTMAISAQDVISHLRFTLFITGSFVVAWSWDLVLYGISHAWHDQNPMRDQIGFGDDKRAPKYLPVLLAEYLMVCGLAAVFSYNIKHKCHEELWCAAAIKAVEFIPAPFFSGKLMAYLGLFTRLGKLQQVLLNLLATGFAAFLAHAAQDANMITSRVRLPPQLDRFRPILAEALGFGLGVAWNSFLGSLLAPDQLNFRHIVGLFGYLVVVLLIAFRVAANVDSAQQNPTLIQRTLGMLSFAFNVVCAFTMVYFVGALLPTGWVGDILSLLIFVLLAAILSAGVAAVDLETSTREQQQHAMEEGQTRKVGFGTCCFMDALIFCPCVWCCCPWIPLVWLMAGVVDNVHVKEKWQELISFVLGLATSIQASGMLTAATNQIAMALNICGTKHCNHAWLFILLQCSLAMATTAVLLPALSFVSEKVRLDEGDGTIGTASGADGQIARQEGERRPLLN